MMNRGNWQFAFEPPIWWWGGPRGGRRRRRQWFEPGDMKYVVLRLLEKKPMHGYEIMKELEEHTCGWYKPSPGTVYPTLQWLEDEGLVAGEEKEGKKVYVITDAGRAFLDENKSTVEDIFDRVEEMIDQFVGDPMPEVNRLVGKLVSKVYRVSWRSGADDDRRTQVAEILERTLKDLDSLSETS